MYVLVPDDPVFFARFESLEEPLLRRLYLLHSAGLESDDERVIADAYDSWVQVLLKLPLWSQWHAADTSAEPAPGEPAGYTLYSAGGTQLTSLYPIEVTAADLGHLTACLDLFVAAGRTQRAVPGRADAEAGADRPEREDTLVDVFRRVMEVLLLPQPQRLLDTLRQAARQGRTGSVTLPAEEETEYRRYCEDIVTILSSGDTFAYRSHRALYL
ncbi:hypothetical protein GCM10010300_51020 [Streptomyces olivaceoviridis]|uniref:hypothetical protein n=1 Tax=Streptomyces olivaceoviridis TaxID=1921 RepID=UPI001673FB30|nr:hypothetical protein [Streptomyces olivaceoviridis]GGZ00940.1 hypothetical protein GCM10010300_51020 [Streptomyces olivaceoviridis]